MKQSSGLEAEAKHRWHAVCEANHILIESPLCDLVKRLIRSQALHDEYLVLLEKSQAPISHVDYLLFIDMFLNINQNINISYPTNLLNKLVDVVEKNQDFERRSEFDAEFFRLEDLMVDLQGSGNAFREVMETKIQMSSAGHEKEVLTYLYRSRIMRSDARFSPAASWCDRQEQFVEFWNAELVPRLRGKSANVLGELVNQIAAAVKLDLSLFENEHMYPIKKVTEISYFYDYLNFWRQQTEHGAPLLDDLEKILQRVMFAN